MIEFLEKEILSRQAVVDLNEKRVSSLEDKRKAGTLSAGDKSRMDKSNKKLQDIYLSIQKDKSVIFEIRKSLFKKWGETNPELKERILKLLE